MNLKDYSDPYQIAEAIRLGLFTYQTVLNHSYKLKSKGSADYIIYSEGCKVYTMNKKKAVANFLKEWSNAESL